MGTRNTCYIEVVSVRKRCQLPLCSSRHKSPGALCPLCSPEDTCVISGPSCQGHAATAHCGEIAQGRGHLHFLIILRVIFQESDLFAQRTCVSRRAAWLSFHLHTFTRMFFTYLSENRGRDRLPEKSETTDTTLSLEL